MTHQPDPLLLALFEAAQKDLAIALEAQKKLSDCLQQEHAQEAAAVAEKIAGLQFAVAAIEAAFDCRPSDLIH